MKNDDYCNDCPNPAGCYAMGKCSMPDAKENANDRLPRTPCSPSSLLVDGCPMVENSAKAMSDEIARLGIIRQKHCACHACGKQVSASDGYPIIKEKYRYSIQCDSCDETVYGHSVDSVCKQWVALYPENSELTQQDL